MSRPASIHRHVFLSSTLACIAAAWVGCATSSAENPTGTSGTITTSSSSSGNGGSGGSGGNNVDFDGGGGDNDSGPCAATSAESHRVPLDMVFLIDRSGSMTTNGKWIGTKAALSTFFYDPASIGISAGLVFFPTSEPYDCDPMHYAALNVPINVLPANAFALTNAIPFDATGVGTPMWGALKGALMAATAYQDAHPTHKAVVVLATDGEPIGCTVTAIDAIADLAQSARSYNGVRTYVIGVAGSIISNLNKIAAAGGTTAAYDITQDINEFAAKIAEIRTEEIGCDFELPEPPNGQALNPDQVNFTYTPQGMGMPKLLPRADDLADCGSQPGWYYDSNASPTRIILCPASCSTVQADSSAKVSVEFGCNSVLN